MLTNNLRVSKQVKVVEFGAVVASCIVRQDRNMKGCSASYAFSVSVRLCLQNLIRRYLIILCYPVLMVRSDIYFAAAVYLLCSNFYGANICCATDLPNK
jgi:hypothetical protein